MNDLPENRLDAPDKMLFVYVNDNCGICFYPEKIISLETTDVKCGLEING